VLRLPASPASCEVDVPACSLSSMGRYSCEPSVRRRRALVVRGMERSLAEAPAGRPRAAGGGGSRRGRTGSPAEVRAEAWRRWRRRSRGASASATRPSGSARAARRAGRGRAPARPGGRPRGRRPGRSALLHAQLDGDEVTGRWRRWAPPRRCGSRRRRRHGEQPEPDSEPPAGTGARRTGWRRPAARTEGGAPSPRSISYTARRPPPSPAMDLKPALRCAWTKGTETPSLAVTTQARGEGDREHADAQRSHSEGGLRAAREGRRRGPAAGSQIGQDHHGCRGCAPRGPPPACRAAPTAAAPLAPRPKAGIVTLRAVAASRWTGGAAPKRPRGS
jgi:hypothetical protein